MHVAFVDESGTPTPADSGSHFVVAALVVTSSRAIELHVRRARRRLHRRVAASELKATHSDPRVVRRMLEAIAGEPCEIYAVVANGDKIDPGLAEPLYRSAVARTIALAVERHPRLHVFVDKRYTNPRQRMALEKRIREAIAHVPDQVVIIDQEDSTSQPGLQAVDFVAWALRRKHEGDAAWAAIIEERVVALENL
jgi:hypothetical protein